VTAANAGRQLAIRIISSNWNEFDNFRLTRSTRPISAPNTSPTWASDPILEADAIANAAYSATLADNATDGDGDRLTFSKRSGPSWLAVASDGTLIGTPGTGDIGPNSFIVRVTDPSGAQDDATLTLMVIPSQILYDINGASTGSSDDLTIWPPARDLAIGPDTASSGAGVTVTPQGDHDTVSIQIPGGPARTFLRLAVLIP
jgi:hypothetical protein